MEGVPLSKDAAEKLEELQDFVARESDVILISYPKSGENLPLCYMHVSCTCR